LLLIPVRDTLILDGVAAIIGFLEEQVNNYRYWVVFALVIALAMPVFPNTYYFSGTVNPVAPSPSTAIPPGTPFTGQMTIDPSVPHCNCADDQHRDYDFTKGTPPGTWQVHIGNGLYDFVANAVEMEEDHNYGIFFGGGDVIWFWANPTPPPTMTGSGQAANPIFFNNLGSVLLWSKPADGILADANTFNVNNIVNIGQWTFAGIDFSIEAGQINGEHYRGAFTQFSSTPPGGGTPWDKWIWTILFILLLLAFLIWFWLAQRRRRATA
jgi:hypothetical protein